MIAVQHSQLTPTPSQKSHYRTRSVFGFFVFASASIYAAYTALGQDPPKSPEIVPSVSRLLHPTEVVCIRNARPLSSIRDEDRVYHAFDNILLIVFFSHARYDANLDYYRATYEEFFPNVSRQVFCICFIASL
jgi:hypothetical protein